jgi:hypothetical protein
MVFYISALLKINVDIICTCIKAKLQQLHTTNHRTKLLIVAGMALPTLYAHFLDLEMKENGCITHPKTLTAEYYRDVKTTDSSTVLSKFMCVRTTLVFSDAHVWKKKKTSPYIQVNMVDGSTSRKVCIASSSQNFQLKHTVLFHITTINTTSTSSWYFPVADILGISLLLQNIFLLFRGLLLAIVGQLWAMRNNFPNFRVLSNHLLTMG